MNGAGGQIPDQPRVNRSEGEPAPLRVLPRPLNMIQSPAQLGGGEIRIQQETGAGPHLRFHAAPPQFIAERGRAAILPDDRVVDRSAGGPVPEQGGFSLIGDAGRGDVAGGNPGLRQASTATDS